jgi:Tfp pilus assembly protein FimV
VRRRWLLVVLAVAVGVLGGIAGATAVGGPAGGSSHAPSAPAADVHTITVQPGDTLWSIASSVVGDGDPRPLVDQLLAEHGAGPLRAGEVLTFVP